MVSTVNLSLNLLEQKHHTNANIIYKKLGIEEIKLFQKNSFDQKQLEIFAKQKTH